MNKDFKKALNPEGFFYPPIFSTQISTAFGTKLNAQTLHFTKNL
jgi:hypothetical protein